jgi:hypothetical protein
VLDIAIAEDGLTDQHQVFTIIATAIHEAHAHCAPDGAPITPEQSKHLAKCVVEALTAAGLVISPAQKP